MIVFYQINNINFIDSHFEWFFNLSNGFTLLIVKEKPF